MSEDQQQPDQPTNHTPLLTPLGTDSKSNDGNNAPSVLRKLMEHYDHKLAFLTDDTNLGDEILLDPAKFMHAIAGRKTSVIFIKSEKAYLQSQIDRLSSKQ